MIPPNYDVMNNFFLLREKVKSEDLDDIFHILINHMFLTHSHYGFLSKKLAVQLTPFNKVP